MEKRKNFLKGNLSSSLIGSFFFIGINISSNVRKLEASIIGTMSSKKNSPIVLYKSVSFDLPEEISQTYDELNRILRVKELYDDTGEDKENVLSKYISSTTKKTFAAREEEEFFSSLAKLSNLRAMISVVQEEAVSELLKDWDSSKDSVVTVAISDPGFWLFSYNWDKRPVYFSLSDSYALSQKTGFNVVDSLIPNNPALDRHGLLLFPYWILLGNFDRGKLVVDLGNSARWFFIPPSGNNYEMKENLYYSNVIPCGSILDVLTKQATKGESSIDIGGKLSVQGRCDFELLEFWRKGIEANCRIGDNFCDKDNSPSYLLNEMFYLERLSRYSRKVSSVDALCSAVHMISERIIDSIRVKEQFYADLAYDVILTGAARQNGLLYSKLSTVLAPQGAHSLDEYGGYNGDSFDSVALAVLGLLFTIGTSVFLYKNDTLENVTVGRLTYGSEGARRRMATFLEQS